MSVLDKKVKDTLKGQGSRDALIETLQGKMTELQQQVDECKVGLVSLPRKRCLRQWRFYVGARGHRPPILAQAPSQIFSG